MSLVVGSLAKFEKPIYLVCFTLNLIKLLIIKMVIPTIIKVITTFFIFLSVSDIFIGFAV